MADFRTGALGVPINLKHPRTVHPLAALPRDLAILLAVFAVVALGVGLRPAALFALIPYALFALCPLSMWLMMRSMNCSNDDTKGKN